MGSSFLVRDINVDVVASSWTTKPVPSELKGVSGQQPFDLGKALHLLGAITMPNILSPASPALFWAWLRYYLAPAAIKSLRITMDFADLDPHQKGILSDDFGVAVATSWFNERYGGLKIVDGRRFILQFPALLRKKHSSKAKVGPNKCPDFVMKDASGRWHVLECKGTQTLHHQKPALRTGWQQKHAIQLVGSVKGERLVSSLFIANEKDKSPTSLKIEDPDIEEPIIRLTGNRAEEMDAKANRLALARALGAIGLSDLAIELGLPPDVDADSDLLRPSEAARVRSPRSERIRRAGEEARKRPFVSFKDRGRSYRGREATFALPPTDERIPFRFVHVRQGVEASVIDELTAPSISLKALDERLYPEQHDPRVATEADNEHTAIRYGDLLYSEVTWT